MEKSPKEEEQAEVEKLLSQNAMDIEEVLKLIGDNTDAEEMERRVQETQKMVEEGHQGRVFHDHKGKKIPLTKHTSHLLKLAGELEVQLKTKRHGKDLHKSLSALARQRVKLLKRVMEKELY